MRMVSKTQMIGQSIATAEPSEREPEAAATPRPTPADGENREQGGAQPRPALDPTRYGDWEKNGRCIDF